MYRNKGGHREDAKWLQKEEEMERVMKITESEREKGLKILANWKAPELDQGPNFWLKHLTALHPKLTKVMNDTIKNPSKLLTCMTRGRTTLMHKKAQCQKPRTIDL